MSAQKGAPGQQSERLAAYLEGLARAAGHADRAAPCKAYCTGLLLAGERKSVELMAARIYPHDVGRKHQSLHHFVAEADWDDERMLGFALDAVVPALLRRGPITAWVVDETGFVKKGRHSVGVARQYCGAVGKQENSRVAVSLSLATASLSMPVAFRLYLPREWAEDRDRRQKVGVPEEVVFQTKPQIALDQIRRASACGLPQGVVLADAVYGSDTAFRLELERMEMQYALGVMSSITVWPPGQQPVRAARWTGTGRPPSSLRRAPRRCPLSVKELAEALPAEHWHTVTWRQGTRKKPLRSRFAALRVRPAHRDYERKKPFPEQWLLIEWPQGEDQPAKYWLSNLPADIGLKALVAHAKHRWIIERDYEELKQELGLGHYEGRNWRGFHHHATLCIVSYGFLVAERARFSPSAQAARLALRPPRIPTHFQPRGSSPSLGKA
jgi:SRSO17 transposase